MPNWIIQAFGFGIVRWLVGTTVQTGIVVSAVLIFMEISMDDMSDRISDLNTTVNRVEDKADTNFRVVREDIEKNTNILAGYTERFNSIENEFSSVRRELSTGLNAISQSITLLDKTSAEPLRSWGGIHLASAEWIDPTEKYEFLLPPIPGMTIGTIGDFGFDWDDSWLVGGGSERSGGMVSRRIRPEDVVRLRDLSNEREGLKSFLANLTSTDVTVLRPESIEGSVQNYLLSNDGDVEFSGELMIDEDSLTVLAPFGTVLLDQEDIGFVFLPLLSGTIEIGMRPEGWNDACSIIVERDGWGITNDIGSHYLSIPCAEGDQAFQ